MIQNIDIYEILNLMTKMLELHEANSFKVNSYKFTARFVKKTDIDLTELSINELMNIDGIGKSIAYSIKEIVDTGNLKALNEYLNKTPKGVIDMLKINGLGPKKIRILWDKMNIDSLSKLLEACKNNKISILKGFGTKTQDLILRGLNFLLLHKYKCLYSIALFYGNLFLELIKKDFPNILISFTGDLRRKMEIIDKIEFVIANDDNSKIIEWLDENEFLFKKNEKSCANTWSGEFANKNIELIVYLPQKKDFYKTLFKTTGSEKHLKTKVNNDETIEDLISKNIIKTEKEFYESININFIPPELREGINEIELAKNNKIPDLIENSDIKGIIHAHSKYSDGLNSLLEMANECIKRGYKYLGITDHSKTAVYAGGLTIENIVEQHKEIDKLNKILKPFKIFKGIESDILKDGSLDYEDEILLKFDFIIGSIHSGFKMSEEDATNRIINAIRNPYLTFLGHPTGRLLLKRYGYPIDHKAIIDECAKNNVIIEINSNPNRLDIDWRWINYAIEKKVLLSINPDAHSKSGFDDIQYGVAMARKGGGTKEDIFTTFSLKQVEEYFMKKSKFIK